MFTEPERAKFDPKPPVERYARASQSGRSQPVNRLTAIDAERAAVCICLVPYTFHHRMPKLEPSDQVRGASAAILPIHRTYHDVGGVVLPNAIFHTL